ncbi:hypothetical protein [Pseudomonas atacamensis]|uniref:hypothetical protein n=1 Tax=Pseudomonas atacamensis TaxID=2565368 RepID=UPI001FAC8B5A|nr:hypothetical protein [Pseudomonas atacamensis]MCI9874476.1 hypothetical protein [Pseudomonas atacamensis]
MTEQFDPKGRYDVIDQFTGDKIGEVVKGVLYQGAPDYRQESGAITVEGNNEGLTFVYDGAVFALVPQTEA